MNWEKLSRERDSARSDKCDLFDFYDRNWSKLVEYCHQLERKLSESDRGGLDCVNMELLDDS